MKFAVTFLAATAASLVALGGAAAAPAEPAPTVKTILQRGKLLCPGHNGSYRGFAEIDDKGAWKGIDIDLCRATAAAILGDVKKLEILPLSWAQRFPALQSGEIDLSVKLTEWTMSRDTELNLQFTLPYFLGGTQFIIHKNLGITSAANLEGATICGEAGTSTIRHASNWLTGRKIKYNLVQFEKQEEAQAAYNSGRCDAFIGFGANLAVFRLDAKGGPAENVLLPELINLSPQSVGLRQGDDRFVDTINWILNVLLAAEQEGITAANVDEMRSNPKSPVAAKILGVDPGLGDRLGLPNDWGYKMIKAVGNYGEIFERNLGSGSPYKLDRGYNNLWNKGGLLYPMTLD